MRNFTMRSITASMSASFESEELLTAVDPAEDGMLAAESAEELAGIETDLATVDSLEARAIGLEDLADTIDENISEATPSELHLVDIAQDMAGVGVDGMEIPETFAGGSDEEGNPSLESFIGRRISTEGMRSKAKEIYEAIMKIVERIWEKIMSLWNSFFDQSKSVVAQAKKLSVAAEAKMGNSLKKDKKDIELGSLTNALSHEGKVPTSPADIMQTLVKCKAVGQEVLVNHAKAVIAAGPKMQSAMKSMDVSKAKKGEEGGSSGLAVSGVLADVAKAADPIDASIRRIFSTKITGDKTYESDSHDFYRSDFLPGNRMIVAKVPKPGTSKISFAYAQAMVVRGMSVNMVLADKDYKPKSDIKIKPFTPAEVVKAADTIVDACGALREYRDKYLRDLQKQKNMLKDAAKAMSGAVTDETHPDAVKMVNATVGFNSSYANWATSPFAAMGSLTLSTARAVMSVGHKSLACYEAA